MSTHVFTLDQVCQERTERQTPFEADTGQNTPLAAPDIAYTTPEALKLHDVLRHLVMTLTLPLPLDELLHALAIWAVQAMETDLCVIMLKDQARDYLRMYTCAPSLGDKSVVVQPVSVDPALWERLRTDTLRGQLPQLSARELASLNPLKNVQYETLVPLPLIAGTECIGLMNYYSSKTLHYTADDQLMLTTIANQAALAIKHRQSVEEHVLAQKTLVKAFVDDLLAEGPDGQEALRRRAYFLGFDLAKPHGVALIELSEMEEPQGYDGIVSQEERLLLYEAVIKRMKLCIDERYPGSLVDERNNLLLCLFNLDGDCAVEQFTAWLDALVRQTQNERHIHLFAGVGNTCSTVGEYRRGYAEAREALEVGRYLNREGGSIHFNDLGAYRYIYKVAQADSLHDRYHDQITSIVEYDRRKKTNLLDTLEVYLECGGNIAKTSNLFHLHRNTLIQRIERLQKLCTLDLEERQNRFALLIALKVYKLRTCSEQHG